MDKSSESLSTRQRYTKLAFENRKLLAIGILSGALAGVGSGFGVPYFTQVVFRKIFENSDVAYTTLELVAIASLLPMIFIVRGVFGYINQYYLQWVGQNMLMSIRRLLFDKLQTLPVRYFEHRQSGDLMAKLVGDTLQIQNALLFVAKDAIVQPITFIGGLSYLVYLSVRQNEIGFILLVVGLTPLIILPVQYISKHLKRRSRELQNTLGDLSDKMAENLRGITEVRSFNLEDRERERFDQKLLSYNYLAMKLAKYFHLTRPLMEWIAVFMVSIAFVYSYKKGVDFSAFAALGAALFFTVDSIKNFVKMFNIIHRASGSFERVESVLTEHDEIEDPAVPTEPPAFKGNIAFKKIRFSYGGDVALSIDDLEISAGSFIALTGPSGAGKSTFARLIPRFYDPQEGDICLDGIPIQSMRKRDVRAAIALVPQNPVLFNGTIEENIWLGNPKATREEVQQAARDAYAEEFILKLPQQYDTHVGENAVRLSGGQRQRLSLARAFLKNAPILILDEATSALDAESEKHIQAALAAQAKGRTILLIAHRFATLKLAEYILVLDQGKIVAQGDLDKVLQNPLFKNLYETQQLS